MTVPDADAEGKDDLGGYADIVGFTDAEVEGFADLTGYAEREGIADLVGFVSC